MNFHSHFQGFRQTSNTMPFDSLDCKLSTTMTTSFRTSSGAYDQMMYDTEIEPTDVLCGRGKTSFNHVGNRKFRDLIAKMTVKYDMAKSRLEKSLVVHQIVEEVKKVKGRFLKQDPISFRWYELDERQAKEKVGHAIRDATSSMVNSNDPKKKLLKKTRSKDSTKSTSSRNSTSSTASSTDKQAPPSPIPVTSTAAVVITPTTKNNHCKKIQTLMQQLPFAPVSSSESSVVTVQSDRSSSTSSYSLSSSSGGSSGDESDDDLEPLHVDSMEAINSLFLLQKAAFRFEVI